MGIRSGRGVRTRSGRGEFVFLADEYERKSDCTKQSTDGVSAVSEPDMSLKREVGRIDCEKEGGEPGADSSHSGEEDDNGTDPFHQALGEHDDCGGDDQGSCGLKYPTEARRVVWDQNDPRQPPECESDSGYPEDEVADLGRNDLSGVGGYRTSSCGAGFAAVGHEVLL